MPQIQDGVVTLEKSLAVSGEVKNRLTIRTRILDLDTYIRNKKTHAHTTYIGFFRTFELCMIPRKRKQP